MAAGVSAYIIKSDLAKLDPVEMAHYFEERIGKSITTAWNLNVKDVEQTISGVCQRVSLICTANTARELLVLVSFTSAHP